MKRTPLKRRTPLRVRRGPNRLWRMVRYVVPRIACPQHGGQQTIRSSHPAETCGGTDTPAELVCGHPDDDTAAWHTDDCGDAVCSRCCPTCQETP